MPKFILFLVSLCFVACAQNNLPVVSNIASQNIDNTEQLRLEPRTFSPDIYTDPESGNLLYSYWVDISKNYDTYPKIYGLSFVPVIFEMQDSKQLICSIYYLSEELLNIQQVMLQIDDSEFITIEHDEINNNYNDDKIIVESGDLLIDVELFTCMSQAESLVFKLIGAEKVQDIKMNKANFPALQWLLEQYNKIDKKARLN